MNKIICYINSNYIDIKKDNKINHIVSNYIDGGDIINSKLFIKEIKEKKLFSSILTNEVTIYLNHTILEKDKIYYKYIFEELNCNQINIYDTSNKLNEATLINNKQYYILYIDKKFYQIIPNLLNEYLKCFKISNLKIISDTKIKENKKINYYYYNNPNSYFINKD